MREPPPFGLRYFRLRGIGSYRYTYTDDDPRRLLDACAGDTYCLFNNLSMANDSHRSRRLLERASE